MTKRDRVVLARIQKARRRAHPKMDKAEDEWSKRLEQVFGNYVNRRDTGIRAAIDRLEITPEGAIANNSANDAVVAQMITTLESGVQDSFARGGAFEQAATPAGEAAGKIATRRLGDTLAAADETVPDFTLTRGQRKRIRESLSQMRFEIHSLEYTNVGKFRDAFMRSIADPTSTRDKLRGDLERLGHGDLLRPTLDSAGRRLTVSERADRIVRYEFAKLTRDVEEQGIVDRFYEGEPPSLDEQFRLWTNPRDDRTQPEHAERTGLVLSIAEWNRRDFGDGRFGLPPLRPRCRCDVIFVVPEWFSKETREKYFTKGGGERILLAA